MMKKPIVIVGLVAAVALYFAWPDEAARERARLCRSYGISSDPEIKRCRASDAEMADVLAPKRQQRELQRIAAYNKTLERVEQGKTRADQDVYKTASVADVAKIAS